MCQMLTPESGVSFFALLIVYSTNQRASHLFSHLSYMYEYRSNTIEARGHEGQEERGEKQREREQARGQARTCDCCEVKSMTPTSTVATNLRELRICILQSVQLLRCFYLNLITPHNRAWTPETDSMCNSQCLLAWY